MIPLRTTVHICPLSLWTPISLVENLSFLCLGRSRKPAHLGKRFGPKSFSLPVAGAETWPWAWPNLSGNLGKVIQRFRDGDRWFALVWAVLLITAIVSSCGRPSQSTQPDLLCPERCWEFAGCTSKLTNVMIGYISEAEVDGFRLLLWEFISCFALHVSDYY